MVDSQDTTAEEWRKVALPALEDLYSVSSLGRIKRTAGPTSGKILKSFLDQYGYPTVELFTAGTGKKISVHRVVALSFIEQHEGRPQVNHKDGCKANNRAENLEWCTNDENMRHAFSIGLRKRSEYPKNPSGRPYKSRARANGRRGGLAGKTKLTESDVTRIRELKKLGHRNTDLAVIYGVDKSRIYQVLNGKGWNHIGSAPASPAT